MEKFVINKKKETQRKRGDIDHLNKHLARIQRFVKDIGFESRESRKTIVPKKKEIVVNFTND